MSEITKMANEIFSRVVDGILKKPTSLVDHRFNHITKESIEDKYRDDPREKVSIPLEELKKVVARSVLFRGGVKEAHTLIDNPHILTQKSLAMWMRTADMMLDEDAGVDFCSHPDMDDHGDHWHCICGHQEDKPKDGVQ